MYYIKKSNHNKSDLITTTCEYEEGLYNIRIQGSESKWFVKFFFLLIGFLTLFLIHTFHIHADTRVPIQIFEWDGAGDTWTCGNCGSSNYKWQMSCSNCGASQ